MKKICILGSTGSIGTQAIEVAREQGFKITALSARSNVELLAKQAREFLPEKVCIFNEEKKTSFKLSFQIQTLKF